MGRLALPGRAGVGGGITRIVRQRSPVGGGVEDRGYVFVAEDGVPGRLVGGRYRLVGEVGSGGMGRVWEARDEQLDRVVAVKEVRLPAGSSVERDDQLRRAEREGRNAAALADHPNVVTVYDVVVEDGVPWIVMQLVRGQSLRTALESGPLEPQRVVEIARALLSALRAVHSAGIVHRDVKPGNVMLTDDGRVLLTDFGIAKSGRDETLTDTGAFVGSLAYASPERLEGEAGGPAGDLFSVGATLFHAVEGVPPFQRDSGAAMLTAILVHPLPPMRRATGNLRTLITALTAKPPGDRPGVDAALEQIAESREFVAARDPEATTEVVSAPRPDHSPPHPPTTVTLPPTLPPPPIGSFTNWPPPPGNSVPGTSLHTRRIRILAITCALALIFGAAVWLGTRSDGDDSTSHSAQTTDATESPSEEPSTRRPSAAESSATPSTTPSTATSGPASTTSVPATQDPAMLDSAATDRTPLTVDALLPQSFTTSKGIYYAMKSGGLEKCPNSLMSERVRNSLTRHGCSGLMVGTYSDTPGRVLVVAMVAVFPDATSATSARAELSAAYAAEWGTWCPPDGPAHQPCTSPAELVGQAIQSAYIGDSHRYLTHTAALYTNLTQSDSLKEWVDSAAMGASYAIGPQNYTGNG